jgi:hypothetical protein
MKKRFFAAAAATVLVLAFGHGANAYNGDPGYYDYDGGMTVEPADPLFAGGGGGLGASSVASVGLSFEGVSQIDVRNLHGGFSFIPPDTMGAVGATQFMETSNGAYAIYSKSTGALQSMMRDGDFWTAAGGSYSASLGPGFNNGDSRILYDKLDNRWVVESFDATDDRIQIAVSQTSDALGAWKAVSFEGFADGHGTGIADYPTLSMDKKAFYIGTNDYTGTGVCPAGFQLCGTTLNVISRSDLMGAGGPSVSSLKQFFTPVDFATENGFAIQGVQQANGGDSGQIIAGGLYNFGLVKYTVINPGTSGATETSGILVDTTPYFANGMARQPDGSRTVDTLDDRTSSSAYEFNGKIYEVQTINPGDDHTYVRVYVVNASTGAPVQEFLIGDGVHDFWQGSIAVSANGKVMIDYNESGTDMNISIFALLLKQAGGGTLSVVGSPMLLHVSPIDDYHNGSPEGSPPVGRQRWGDYSQVTVDPNNANSFWIIGEFAHAWQSPTGFSRWGTWITNITATPEPSTWVMTILGFGALGGAMRRRRKEAGLA